MSPIMDLLAAIKDKDDIVDVGCDAIVAGADLQRLVEWIRDSAIHLHDCGPRPGSTNYCKALKAKEEPKCTCGLSEIQSLLGE